MIIPDTIYGYSVQAIGFSAFAYNSILKNVSIPASVQSLGSLVFERSLVETVIFRSNSQMTELITNTFKEAEHLKSVIFESGSQLKSIADYAFFNLSQLNTVIIPDGVINMGATVFLYSHNVTIYSGASSQPETWNDLWNIENRPVVWGWIL